MTQPKSDPRWMKKAEELLPCSHHQFCNLSIGEAADSK